MIDHFGAHPMTMAIWGRKRRVEVGENGQNSEGVVLRSATEFASLVVLLCKNLYPNLT